MLYWYESQDSKIVVKNKSFTKQSFVFKSDCNKHKIEKKNTGKIKDEKKEQKYDWTSGIHDAQKTL